MTGKETRQIVREYERNGFSVAMGRHIKIFSPSGQLVTVLSRSRCEGRADANARAVLKRAVRQAVA